MSEANNWLTVEQRENIGRMDLIQQGAVMHTVLAHAAEADRRIKNKDHAIQMLMELAEPMIRRIAELEADQSDWRKGVELIASALGESTPPNLSCVRLSEVVLKLRVALEQRDELINELLDIMDPCHKEYAERRVESLRKDEA